MLSSLVLQVWDDESSDDLVSLLVPGDPSGADIGLEPDGEEDPNAEGHYANSYPDEDTEPGGLDEEEEQQQWEGQDSWASSGEEEGGEDFAGFRGLGGRGGDSQGGFGGWEGIGEEGGGRVMKYAGGGSGRGRGGGGDGGGSSSEEFDVEEYEAEEEWRWQQEVQQRSAQGVAGVTVGGEHVGAAGVDARRVLLGS